MNINLTFKYITRANIEAYLEDHSLVLEIDDIIARRDQIATLDDLQEMLQSQEGDTDIIDLKSLVSILNSDLTEIQIIPSSANKDRLSRSHFLLVIGRYIEVLWPLKSHFGYLIDILNQIVLSILLKGDSLKSVIHFEELESKDIDIHTADDELPIVFPIDSTNITSTSTKSEKSGPLSALVLWLLYNQGFFRKMSLGSLKSSLIKLTGHAGLRNYILDKDKNTLKSLFNRDGSTKSLTANHAKEFTTLIVSFLNELMQVNAKISTVVKKELKPFCDTISKAEKTSGSRTP